MSMSVAIYAEDDIGWHVSVQLQGERSRVHKDKAWKGDFISRGQNVSMSVYVYTLFTFAILRHTSPRRISIRTITRART